jgi:hypothetical protein
MKMEQEFCFNKEKTKRKLIKNIIILIITISAYFLVFYNLPSVLITLVSLAALPVFCSYLTLKSWKEFNYTEPVLKINKNYLVFKKLNYILNYTDTEIKIDEIKSIGKDTKMNGQFVQSELLCLKMLNSDKYIFDIEILGLSHNDLFKLIKELKPEAKLLNIGELVHD